MEELKRKVKVLIPHDKHLEIDKIFSDWVASLKVHTILDKDSAATMSTAASSREASFIESNETDFQKDRVPLKNQIEELKKQIETFKQKMRVYKESDNSSTDMALNEVKEEIGRVREGIVRMRQNFSSKDDLGESSGNAELIEKLDEVKKFLEKLK